MSTENYEKTAVMFADVEGSTRMYETLGDIKAQQNIEDCMALMSTVIEQCNGTIIKTIGDEIMCRFDNEDQAVKAACELQEAMEERSQRVAVTPAIRIGLHYGLAIQKDGDVFGDAVNVAARMASIARGKQIITTEETIVNLDPGYLEKTRKFDRTTVKGKQEEITIYEVLWRSENITAMHTGALNAVTNISKLTVSYQGNDWTMEANSPDTVIGRDERCTIPVDSNFASRIHARIEFRRGKFVLIDQSTNGTHVKTDRNDDIYIRREEIPLFGEGFIALGEAVAEDGPNIIKYKTS